MFVRSSARAFEFLPRTPARALLTLLLMLQYSTSMARTLELPLSIPYALVRNQLAERVFAGPGESVQILRDDSTCNRLSISTPQVTGTALGRVHVTVRVEAHGGTPIASYCVLPFSWDGVVELSEQAYVGNTASAIAFRIVDSNILDAQGQQASVPGVVWNWIKRYVQDRKSVV